ncbi:MAG: hypothetical protein SH809_02500 [Rhodothermales bacterium]|nr:hypothetical protein [Rhodothermales bacterium]
MNKTLLTLAFAGLAMMSVRSLSRMRRTHLTYDFPVERCTAGLFV